MYWDQGSRCSNDGKKTMLWRWRGCQRGAPQDTLLSVYNAILLKHICFCSSFLFAKTLLWHSLKPGGFRQRRIKNRDGDESEVKRSKCNAECWEGLCSPSGMWGRWMKRSRIRCGAGSSKDQKGWGEEDIEEDEEWKSPWSWQHTWEKGVAQFLTECLTRIWRVRRCLRNRHVFWCPFLRTRVVETTKPMNQMKKLWEIVRAMVGFHSKVK